MKLLSKSRWWKAAISLSLLLAALQCSGQLEDPPQSFQDSQIAGTWEANYWGLGVDRLTIRADSTFRQTYRDRSGDHAYETQWNTWWTERLADGRIWLHLQGARYYLGGVAQAEREGAPPPYGYYDPFGEEYLEMRKKLVLNVRQDTSGTILLHHMWSTADRGFAIFGGDAEVFRRVAGP
jgi:hypothetical protein